MSCIPEANVAGWLDRLDERVRLATALVFAFLFAVLQRPESLSLATGLVAALTLASRIRPGFLFRRLFLINSFSVFILIVVPPMVQGQSLFRLGPISYSLAGLILALKIVIRLNLVVTLVTVVLGSLSPVRIGHALTSWRLAPPLVHLFLFSVRYAGLIRSEYHRVFQAMRLRGFEARFGLHTLRSYANALGMVLVSSYDRGERIQRAMLLRGFSGELHHEASGAMSRSSWLAFLAASIVFVLVFCLEAAWMPM